MKDEAHRPSCCCDKCIKEAPLVVDLPPKPVIVEPPPEPKPLPPMDSQEALKAAFAPKRVGRPTNFEKAFKDATPVERGRLMRMDPDWVKRIAVLAITDPTVRDAIRRDLTVEEQTKLAREIVAAAQPIAALKMVDLLESEKPELIQRAASDIMDRGPMIKNQPQTQWQAPIVIVGFDPEKLWGSTPKAKNVTIKYKATPTPKEKE